MSGRASDALLVRCYTRVSTEEQALSGYSLSAQREQLLAYIQRMGWNCAGWYVDEGRSAKDLNRPEFQRLMREADRGDVVLVTKLDRLTRSVRDLDELLRQFAARDLLFQSASEQFETRTPGGRLYMGIVAVIAQWEREIIADRSAMGKKQKVVQGEWAGGPVPFGYSAVPSGQIKRGRELLRLVPDPSTAHVVRSLFERYTAGQGMRALCIWLNDEALVPTANGSRWRVSSLTRLLTNPLYAGYVTHGRRKGGEVLRVKGSHPALVSEELFERTQQMFETRKRMAPRQATGAYPLAGIARCGLCGGAVDSSLQRRKGSYIYRCRQYVNGVGCGNGSVKPNSGTAGEIVEQAVVTAMEGLPQPRELDRFLQLCAGELDQAAGAAEPERRRLRAEQSKAARAIRRWEEVFEAGEIGWAELQQRTLHHRERIRAILAQLEQMGQAPPSLARPISGAVDIRAAWRHLSPPERKALLQEFVRAFGVQIRLFPDRRVELVPTEA